MKRMRRSTPILLLLGLLAWWSPDQAQAQCRAYTSSQTYANGDSMGHLDCDLSGNLRVTGGGTATAADPTYTEGAPSAFSFKLNGELRVSPGVFIGADQTNNLLMTSGGVVRQTAIATGLLVGADCTSACTFAVVNIIPTGMKILEGRVVSTTSGATVTQTQKIYGGSSSSMTTSDSVLLCTMILSGTQSTTKAIVGVCPGFTSAYSYYGVIGSGTYGAPLAMLTVASAAAAKSPMTQYIDSSLLTDGPWFYKIASFNASNNLSALSSEVSITVTGKQ
jgi:hypothetical protein